MTEVAPLRGQNYGLTLPPAKGGSGLYDITLFYVASGVDLE